MGARIEVMTGVGYAPVEPPTVEQRAHVEALVERWAQGRRHDADVAQLVIGVLFGSGEDDPEPGILPCGHERAMSHRGLHRCSLTTGGGDAA